ncbi:MAG: type 2 isopentenyl-diphosphate Delta-isomerase [Methanomassiliicoccus sp.]|nr:type 2 isopentenyl-diphosphate Delta-isomerase [Methanomassiliicoccus sp.]
MKGIEQRKAEHIQVSLEEDVASAHDYWNDVNLVHEALPEVDLEEVDTSTVLFGRKLACPLMVTAITGGHPLAEKINRNLAEACANLRIGLGVGSQRPALEKGARKSYEVIKDYDVPLKVGNIGAPQLIPQKRKRAFGPDDARKAIDMIDADLLAIHLNFLQEIAQPEGDTKARGCYDGIRSLSRELPILIKETGAGISRGVAMRLKGIGVRGLDVAGAGGTSFSKVEGRRATRQGDCRCERIAATFAEWGIPAPVSVMWADVGLPIIASGGIENGLQAAKGIAVGADCAGLARAVLREAMDSPKAVEEKLSLIIEEMRIAMFLTGSRNVRELGNAQYIITGITREWAAAEQEI